MKKERFDFIRMDAESGNDAFVTHPSTAEEGRVLDCKGDHLIVMTMTGRKRDWDYRECEELSRRKEEWPYR